jgi:hypothetical protein
MARDVASELIVGSRQRKQRENDNQIYSLYLAEFDDIEVKNSARGVNYAELPCDPDDIGNNEGIMNVWPRPTSDKAKHKKPIIPLPVNADVVFSSLPAGALETRFGFRPYRDRIEFTTIRQEDKERTMLQENIDKVKIQMVTTAPEDVPDDEPFPMAPHLRTSIIVKLLSMFGVPEEEIKKLNKEE